MGVPSCASMCVSMPAVCQYARGSSQKCLSFPEVPEGPRCPEGQDIVPLCQMAQNPQDWYLWHNFYLIMMIFVLFYLSCDSLLAVGTVKGSFTVYIRLSVLVLTCTKFSLLIHIHLFIHKSYSNLIGERWFYVNRSQFCLVFLAIILPYLLYITVFDTLCISNSQYELSSVLLGVSQRGQ